MKGYLTSKQVMELLECTRWQFNQAVADGRLVPVKHEYGKKRWFRESEIKELIGDAA